MEDMRSTSVALAAIFLGCVSGSVSAQSLAEASAAAKLIPHEWPTSPNTGSPSTVITNADLPAVSPSPSGTLSPKLAGILATIKTKCAQDWPDDFKMRAYCQDQQLASLSKIAARNEAGTMKTADGQVIRTKCVSEWPGDFKMINYCEEQQLKALGTLGR